MSQFLHRAGLLYTRPAVAISLTDSATVGASGGVATFTSSALGAAAADRWIYVVATSRVDVNISALTIGGNAAQVVAGPVRNTGPSPDSACAIYRLLEPSGTTATITVTMAGSSAPSTAITIYRVVGGIGQIFDSATEATNGAATGSVSLNIPARGGAIAGIGNNGTSAVTWTNITEDTDFANGSDRHSAASRVDVNKLTALAISNSAGVYSSLCAVAIR